MAWGQKYFWLQISWLASLASSITVYRYISVYSSVTSFQTEFISLHWNMKYLVNLFFIHFMFTIIEFCKSCDVMQILYCRYTWRFCCLFDIFQEVLTVFLNINGLCVNVVCVSLTEPWHGSGRCWTWSQMHVSAVRYVIINGCAAVSK